MRVRHARSPTGTCLEGVGCCPSGWMAVNVKKPCSHGANRASRKASVSGCMTHRLEQGKLLGFSRFERDQFGLALRPIRDLDRCFVGFGHIEDAHLTPPPDVSCAAAVRLGWEPVAVLRARSLSGISTTTPPSSSTPKRMRSSSPSMSCAGSGSATNHALSVGSACWACRANRSRRSVTLSSWSMAFASSAMQVAAAAVRAGEFAQPARAGVAVEQVGRLLLAPDEVHRLVLHRVHVDADNTSYTAGPG